MCELPLGGGRRRTFAVERLPACVEFSGQLGDPPGSQPKRPGRFARGRTGGQRRDNAAIAAGQPPPPGREVQAAGGQFGGRCAAVCDQQFFPRAFGGIRSRKSGDREAQLALGRQIKRRKDLRALRRAGARLPKKRPACGCCVPDDPELSFALRGALRRPRRAREARRRLLELGRAPPTQSIRLEDESIRP